MWPCSAITCSQTSSISISFVDTVSVNNSLFVEAVSVNYFLFAERYLPSHLHSYGSSCLFFSVNFVIYIFLKTASTLSYSSYMWDMFICLMCQCEGIYQSSYSRMFPSVLGLFLIVVSVLYYSCVT